MIVLLGVFTFSLIIASIIGIKRQMALVNKGDYEGAVNKFMEKHRRYENRYGYKGNYAIIAANCLNRMGEFQKSNECLEKVNINNLDKITRASYYAIYSDNIYFGNGYLKTASENIKIAKEPIIYSDIWKFIVALKSSKPV